MIELLHALAFDPDDSELDLGNIPTPTTVVRVYLGFLQYREDNDLVQFSHATVARCLKSECDEIFKDSGFIVARSCVRYLSQQAFAFKPCQTSTELLTRFSYHPLLRYTALYRGEYVFNFQTELASDVQKLLDSQNTVSNAAQGFHYLRRKSSTASDEIFLSCRRPSIGPIYWLCGVSATLRSCNHYPIVKLWHQIHLDGPLFIGLQREVTPT